MKLESPQDPLVTAPTPQSPDLCGRDEQASLDGDFPVEGDGGTVSAGQQAHLPPPPPPNY